MSTIQKTLTPTLVKKLWLAFILLAIMMGVSYIGTTNYLANKHSQEMLLMKSFRMPLHF